MVSPRSRNPYVVPLFLVIVAAGAAARSAEAGEPARSPAVRVWASDLISDAFAGRPADAPSTVSIIGARNGTFSGRVIVESSAPIKGLRAAAGALTMAGASIPAANVRVRYAVPWDGRAWHRYRPSGLDILLESPPAEVTGYRNPPLAAAWITVKVPRDAKPGVYNGRLRLKAAGLPATTVPVELRVADWALPDRQDYRTWVGMIQSPDTLAMEYNVPLWSKRHWQLIARSFGHMSEVGCRNVFIPLLCRTNFGNEESMVRWIRKGEGKYDYDFTVMDQYLDMAEKHLGTPKMVTFQVWELYLSPRSLTRSLWKTGPVKGARQALQGKGPRVTVVDPKTGKTEPLHLPRFEDPASEALWRPLFAELRKRMKRRGLEKAMMIGLNSDVWPSKEEVVFLHRVSGGLPWASHAHPGRLRNRPAVGNKLLHRTADVGYEAHVYGLGYQVNPAKGRHYGWRRPALVVRFARNGWPNTASVLQMRLLPAFNITGDQRGVGRIGADVWYVFKNRRGRRSGAIYRRYPEANWRNLDIESWVLAPGPEGAVATARLENLRQGVQECEARILIERALLDPARRKRLGERLAGQCEALLNERQRAMWKTVWSNDADLDGLGLVRARNPIESLWQALTKGGKKLPGYWDSEARRMRRDEAIKGRAWFAASGWQERNAKLFTLAGAVAKKLGITARDRARAE